MQEEVTMVNAKKIEHLWSSLKDRFELSEQQLEMFYRYAVLLQSWNKKMNISAIDDIEEIIVSHFQDSLEITRFVDFTRLHTIADVGTGGGFPGLPLKIMFPHLQVVLIEVIHKKIQFLQTVVDELGLTEISFVDLDWRTFLRQSEFSIDLFLARASLQPIELIRLFKPGSIYSQSHLIYWASIHWKADTVLKPYIKQDAAYVVGDKQRRYIFFANIKKIEDNNRS